MEKRLEIRTKKLFDEETNEPILADDGKQKCYYKVFTKKGWISLCFNKTVENRPLKSCIIFVDEENLSINTKGRFVTWFVSKINRIEEYASTAISDYFD